MTTKPETWTGVAFSPSKHLRTPYSSHFLVNATEFPLHVTVDNGVNRKITVYPPSAALAPIHVRFDSQLKSSFSAKKDMASDAMVDVSLGEGWNVQTVSCHKVIPDFSIVTIYFYGKILLISGPTSC